MTKYMVVARAKTPLRTRYFHISAGGDTTGTHPLLGGGAGELRQRYLAVTDVQH